MTSDQTSIPKPRLLKPGEEDEKIERALERALSELEPEKEEPASNRDLVQRSRTSFAKHLAQLQERIDTITRDIDQSMRERDEAIIKAEKRHTAFLHEAEKDLYQIKTLKAAIELAQAALGMEGK